MTLPTTNTSYTVTFGQPTLTMLIKKRQYLPQLGRFIDYKVNVTLPIMEDNSLRLSTYQLGRIVDLFRAELIDLVKDGLDLSQLGEQEVVVEAAPVRIVPAGDDAVDKIQSLIVQLPGRLPAMLAKDLAVLYGVSTGNLNKAVDRNIDRFPHDFMFQSTDKEKNHLFQFGISRNVPSLPYLFTQFGANQLSTVLRSKRATEISIQIMRAFTLLSQGVAPCQIQEKLDEAVITKAAIGDKKVASALAKAGNLTKENKKLTRENQELRRQLAVNW